MEEEIWVEFKRTNGYYEISSLGRIRAMYYYSPASKCHVKRKAPKMLDPSINKGYLAFSPCILNIGIKETEYFHRVVAEHFLDDYTESSIINHKNGVKWDNRAINLECTTHKENIQHAVDTGLLKSLYGERHPKTKLKNSQVLVISKSYASTKDLSLEYNVSTGTINGIRVGLYWGKVTGIKYKKEYNTISKETVLSIFNENGRHIDIAKKYNATKSVVQAIKCGRTFSAITGKMFQQKYYLSKNKAS